MTAYAGIQSGAGIAGFKQSGFPLSRNDGIRKPVVVTYVPVIAIGGLSASGSPTALSLPDCSLPLPNAQKFYKSAHGTASFCFKLI